MARTFTPEIPENCDIIAMTNENGKSRLRYYKIKKILFWERLIEVFS